MKSILLAPNSFKECADSIKIADLLENSLNKYLSPASRVSNKFIKKPISDGGDGFIRVCERIYNFDKLTFNIPAPFENKNISVELGYSKELKTIIIESASVLGLKIVPVQFRKPEKLSSFGLGILLLKINNEKMLNKFYVDKVIIGIGGTATNDMGLGCAEAFGLKLIDEYGVQQKIVPKNYFGTKEIVFPKIDLNFEIELVLDVDNPLVGEKGATNIFGRQKGLNEFEIQNIEAGFKNILKVLKLTDEKINELKGAGGGLAAGLQLLFNASLTTSKEFILNEIGINSSKTKFDLVITGEGEFDNQSFAQKGSMVVIGEFETSKIPIIVICGDSEIDSSQIENLTIYRITDYFDSKQESIENYEKGLDIVCEKIVNNFLI